MFENLYHEVAVKSDMPRLSTDWRQKIRVAIETKLATDPELYGKPLRRSLKNYRKLRVGDYRVIFRIDGHQVKVFVIQHRSKVYDNFEKRM